MAVEPSDRLKEQLDPEILHMIREYNQRDYDITQHRLCGSNENYDAQLMSQHYPQLNQLYEEERQRLKNDWIVSSRNYTATQEVDLSFMENYLEGKLRGGPLDQETERMFAEARKRESILYEEVLRRTDLKRDYLFLQKVVRYYRISLLVNGRK
jgi:hypothetical protein